MPSPKHFFLGTDATGECASCLPCTFKSFPKKCSIWIWVITSCFLIQDQFGDALTIHENTFNHVKEKFINIHFNDLLVPACVTESTIIDIIF